MAYTAEYRVDGESTDRYLQTYLRCRSAPDDWVLFSDENILTDATTIAMLLSDPPETTCSGCTDAASADIYGCVGEDIVLPVYPIIDFLYILIYIYIIYIYTYVYTVNFT